MRRCANPLLYANVKLFVCQLHSIPSNDDKMFFLGDVPVTHAEIVGVVVSVVVKDSFFKFAVDDGTGVVMCIVWLNDAKHAHSSTSAPPLGALVSVCGKVKISRYCSRRELSVDTVALLDDPDAESLFWLETLQMHRAVYPTLTTS
eukprot:gnl/Spiro4/6346_TR3271_c0_g2_i1.p1 gnl/Spiro4/6346_TR3271_c0_g2~~gnl/Spiro4/6346_TR3271_c0_g2_i1.p1  ORF type:complete len:171 (+),score=50.04 gnl/Spiro4/6346_TR3271_c0_g2_i1:76-513(+)